MTYLPKLNKFAAVAVLTWCAAAHAADLRGEARVIDGDTIEVAGERIRLLNIDAPEVQQVCTNGARRWPCGKTSSRVLRDYLKGRTVYCSRQGLDKYQRTLATCYFNTRDGRIQVGTLMVATGWAFAYRNNEKMLPYQKLAAAGKLGFWDSDVQAPWEWRAARRGK